MNSMNLHIAAMALVLVVLSPGRASTRAQPQAPITGILGAFSDEVAILEQALTDAQPQTILGIRFVTGKLMGRRVVVASSGVGKVNAAMSATLLIDHFRPSEVLYSGIAGAVNPDLHPGDIVIGEKTVQHDLGTLTPEGIQRRGMRNPVDWKPNPVFLDADPELLGLAEVARKRVELEKIQTSEGQRTPKIIKGIVATGDVFVASPAKKEELRKALNADAVEMEGAAVAQVCRELGVPCLVIRSITDSADANARKDSNLFFPVAAQNSSRLVMDIVGQLASAPAPRKRR